MKILFFSTYFYPYISGITTYPLKILKYLSIKDDVTVLTFPHSKDSNFNGTGLKVRPLPYFFRLSKGFISLQSFWIFAAEAKKTDIVFLNIPNFEGWPLAIWAKLFGKKVYAIFHCQVKLDNRLRNRLINKFLDLSILLQLLLSEKIITNTEDYFNSLKISSLFAKKTAYVLPPVDELKVDLKAVKKFKKIKANELWVGYAGRFASEKGLEYLVAAVARISKNLKNVRLVFAGPAKENVIGENVYSTQIADLIKKMSVKNIVFGQLDGPTLKAFYKTVDVLCLPSINKTEAFGMVQVEAMLQGTPVVSSNLPGVRIPVKLTHMGKVVSIKNVDEISNAIEKILINPKKYTNKKLVNNAKKIFSSPNTYKFYDDLIHQKNAHE